MVGCELIDAHVIAHLKDGRKQALAAQFFAPDPGNLSRKVIEDELLEFFSVQVGHPQIPNGPIAPIERIEIASLTVVGKDQPYLSPEGASRLMQSAPKLCLMWPTDFFLQACARTHWTSGMTRLNVRLHRESEYGAARFPSSFGPCPS